MHELFMVPFSNEGFSAPVWSLDVKILLQCLYKVNQDPHA